MVHNAEVLVQGLGSGNGLIADGVGMFGRVFIVYPVDFRSFDENVAMEFERAEHRGGVGGEIRVSRSSHRDDDATVFQMLDCPTLDEKLAYAVDFERAHDAHFPSVPLDGVSKRDSVDNGREHSHVVALGAVEAFGGHRRPSEDIASSDDDDDLFPRIRESDDLGGEGMEEVDVDSVSYGTLERFAGKFEKEAFCVSNEH